MSDLRAERLGDSAIRPYGWVVAPASVVVGSLLTALPFVATFPIQPPFGLLVLIAWRVRRPDVFAPWAPVPLGLADDLVSGQPLGSAMLFWTLATLAIAVLETRLVWRTALLDWTMAAGAVAFCLLGGRAVATPFSAHVDTPLLLQIVASVALCPFVARIVARLDRWRGLG